MLHCISTVAQKQSSNNNKRTTNTKTNKTLRKKTKITAKAKAMELCLRKAGCVRSILVGMGGTGLKYVSESEDRLARKAL